MGIPVMPITPDEQNTLLTKAKEVKKNAHCIYSKFSVGAAILTVDGQIYTGCNVENAAYPTGICAEQNAIGTMISGGGRKNIKAIAIVTNGKPSGEIVGPCGQCRQMLREFCVPTEITIIVSNDTQIRCLNLEEIFPFSFGPSLMSLKD